jgi:RNA polymerase II elongation factor ELL
VLKTTTWLEVRPFQWKLKEKERLTMARNARMAFKTLRIPESDPAWDNVTYRSTTNTTPTSNSAAGVSSSKGSTVNATPGGPSSSSKLEAKRGVMSKDIKEKKAKVKAEAQKQKTEVHMKDEGAKASKAAAAAASTKGKEPAESPASRPSASHSQASVKKHPGSASKAAKQSSAQDGVETPTRPSTPGDSRPVPRTSIV